MKTRYWSILLVLLITSSLGISPASAQGSETQLLLSLDKTFGYNDFEGNIQGTFTLRIKEIDSLIRVVFFIDGKEMGQATTSPFTLKFDTSSYTTGIHVMSAIGYTRDGGELGSNEIRARFITAEEGNQKVTNLILPILGLVFGVLLLSFLALMLKGGNKLSQLPLGAQRNYGLFGGAICDKCRRPFSIHMLGINLLFRKLDRCPYCGKWSLVRRVSSQELSKAEAAELEQSQMFVPGTQQTEDHFRRDVDESRFLDR